MKGKCSTWLITSWLLILFGVSAPSLADPEGTIEYCIDPNWMPYEAIQAGEHVGLSYDYLLLFKQHVDYQFELVETQSWQQSIEFLQSAQCKIVLMLNQSESRRHFLSFSDVYFRSPNVLVSKREQPFLHDLSNIGERKLGVVKNYRIAEFIKVNFPDIQLVELSSEQEGMAAVVSGKIDVFAGSLLSINARTGSSGLGELKIAGWAGPEDELRVGVVKGFEYLLPMFNKAIQSFTEQDRVAIFSKWNNTKIIKEADYSLLYKVSGIALIIASLLYWRQLYLNRFNKMLTQKNIELENIKIKLENTNKELQYLSFHDPLTDLYNRHYFSNVIEQELKRIKRNYSPNSLMLIDIDYFKRVNDEHGHVMGDKVLQSIAKIFKNVIRGSDIAARWGGEEFIFLIQESSPEDAYVLAERLRQEVADFDFELGSTLTISIGLAEFDNDDDFAKWLDRADKALYLAKAQGRNQTVVGETVFVAEPN